MIFQGVTMRFRFLLLSFLLCLAGVATAQTTVIRAGHVVDPATGTVQDNQIILINPEGKITAVGADVKIPGDATVIDLSGSWVLPGLMDAHTHLTLGTPPRSENSPSHWASTFAYQSTGLRAIKGIWNAGIVLRAGFTTIKDIGNAANYADPDIRRAIEAGWFPGPTVLNTGKIIAPFGGQVGGVGPEIGPYWQFEYLDADSPDEIRRAVRENLYYGANAIKLVADQYDYYYSEEEIRAAVEEARKASVTVAIHTAHDDSTRNAVLAGADSIEHGWELTDEILQLMKEKGTVLVGTDFPEEHLGMYYPPDRAKKVTEQILDRLSRAHKVGVKMAFGTDVVVDSPDKSRAEMMLDYLAVWEAAGVPPAGILKAMTTNAAELMRIEKERGAIRAGLQADIIATPENPLENIHTLRQVHFVMKDGSVIKQ
jgi:imidazolonepropionase-like amidohydrolase